MNSLLLLFLSLNSSASLDCANVDLNQLSDDKISEYTHCFKNIEATIAKTPKATSKLKFIPVCERSAPVKVKLEEVFDNSCEQITKAKLFAYSGTIDMYLKSYHKPKPGDFSGMNNLKTLVLIHNQIVSLPTGLFDDLESLQKLNLGWNHIEELPINIFDKLLKLENLNLLQNNIKTLPVGIFDALRSLKTLNLSYNLIKETPMNIFDKMLKLGKLSLDSNNIKVLSRPIISSRDNSLYYLGFFSNPLTHIYNSAFENLSQLKKLDLSYTDLSIIGKSVFTPLLNLSHIDLSGIQTDNTLINEQANEATISFRDISLAQFTLQKPFPLLEVKIYYNDSQKRKQILIDPLREKGVNVFEF